MTVEIYPVAIGHYQHHHHLDVDAEVSKVASVLSDFGAELLRPWQTPMSERDGDAVDDRLDDWPTEGAAATILYWVGHGWSNTKSATLAHARSRKPVGKRGTRPDELADAVVRWQALAEPDSWLFVVLDACKSGRFVELLAAELNQLGGRHRVVLLSTSNAASTTLGRFSRELEQTLAYAFANNQAIRVVELANQLSEQLNGTRRVFDVGDEAVLLRDTPIAAGYQGPLDIRQELDRLLHQLPVDERQHFIVKAHGGDLSPTGTLGEPTWYFTGRDAERSAALESLQRGGLTVVTGRAGSGKSALLGDLLVRSRPGLARLLGQEGLLKPARHADPPPFDAAVHLSGMPTDQVVARLCTDLCLQAPDLSTSASERVTHLAKQLEEDPRPRRLLIDALDESVEPHGVADLLRRLGQIPQLSVLVGTRRSTLEGPDQPETDDTGLLDALGAAFVVEVTHDPDAVFDYVRGRLNRLSEGVDPAALDHAARIIAGVDQEFLYARLATHELLRRPDLIRAPDLLTTLGSSHRSLFAAATQRLSGQDPAFEWLLAALGVAQGRGVPILGGVWAQIAAALAATVAHVDIVDEAIHRLIEAASPYLTVDSEHEQTVYRLAHHTFAEHFVRDVERARRWHGAIVSAAIDLLEQPDSDNPYWRYYTSTHCAEAGLENWQRLARSTALGRLDPSAVAADAMRSLFGRGTVPMEVASIIGSRHHLATAPLSDHWGLRGLAAARLGGSLDNRLRPDWAAWSLAFSAVRHQPLHTTLTGHVAGVNAVAFGVTGEGRLLLASGSDDHSLRVWDAVTGQPVGKPLTDHTGPVNAVAFGVTGEGRLLLASGSDDHSLRVWDAVTGQPVGKPLTDHTGPVNAVAFGATGEGQLLLASGSGGLVQLWDANSGRPLKKPRGSHSSLVWSVAFGTTSKGQLLLASGSTDKKVRVWDANTGQPVGERLTSRTRRVRSVAFGATNASRLLLASSSVGSVQLWDETSRRPIGEPLTGHTGQVRSVAFGTTSEGQLLLASGSGDNSLKVWDANTGQQAGVAQTGHTHAVRSLAFGVSSDDQLLVASSSGGSVQLWDAETGRPAGEPLIGHTSGVLSVAFGTTSERRLVLATGSGDKSVRLWDARTGEPEGRPLIGHTNAINAVTFGATSEGRLLLATGSVDRSVRVWDADTGRLVGEPLIGHTRAVRTVALAATTDGRLLLASGGTDKKVWMWDPVTSRPVGNPLTGHTRPVSSVAFGSTREGLLLVASGSIDGSVRVWDASTGQPAGKPLTGHTGWVNAVTFGYTGDGRLLLASGGVDGSVRVWDPMRSQQLRWIPAGVRITALAISSSGMLAAGMPEGFVVIKLADNGLDHPAD